MVQQREKESIKALDTERVLSEPLPWEKLKGTSILVTGCSGMLSIPMVEALLALGDDTQVYGLARNAETVRQKMPQALTRSNFHFIESDVCNFTTFEGPLDYIIHAASLASPKFYGPNPVDVILPNTKGTQQLLSLAVEKQVKGFLYISSGEIYGSLPTSVYPINEEASGSIDPLSIRACYAESKRMGEALCMAYFRQYDLPVTIVRPFHTFGPDMNLDDGRVFADFVADIVQHRKITLKSDGAAQRAFCYVSDAVAAIFTAWLVGSPGQAYNIGNDQNILSIRQLAEMLVAIFPERKLEIEALHAINLKSSGANDISIPDLSKIRALGWHPSVSIADGFKKVITSIEAQLMRIPEGV